MNKLEELIEKICPNGVEFKELQEICNVAIGEFVHKNKQREGAIYPVFNGGISNTGFYDEYNNEGNKVLVSARGANAGFVNKIETRYWAGNSCYSIAVKDSKYINWLYVYYFLKNNEKNLLGQQQTGSIPAISKKQIESFKIAVPPLEVQCEIVHILDDFTLLSAELSAELKARQKQYEYYKNKIFEKNYPKKKLGEIGQVKMCKRILKHQTNTVSGIPFYKIGTFGGTADAFISEETYKEYLEKYNSPKKGDILISCAGTIGRTVVYDGKPAYFQDSNIVWLEHNENIVLNKYLKYCYSLSPWDISTGGTIARLYNDNILKAEIPVPSIEEQKKIIAILEKFDKITNDILEGLPAEIEARQKQYEYYRDKLLTFKELKVEE